MTKRFDPALLPTRPDLSLERGLWQAGVARIAGMDEAGRGALAGPVCAAAVIFPAEPELFNTLFGVNDSKKMTAQQRDSWAATIQETALACSVAFASSLEIDQIGIVPATHLAMQRALTTLRFSPDHLLIDALLLSEVSLPQTSLLKGDARSLSIAAASILAKTSRDNHMRELDRQYPRYGFAKHKGYGTAFHRAAMKKWGPCPIHRITFAPLREML
ncbi:MAG: ribonuclease HII [Anaerolineae bacterium]|nr:ribonuclease HII [Anaerolineae bacterium]